MRLSAFTSSRLKWTPAESDRTQAIRRLQCAGVDLATVALTNAVLALGPEQTGNDHVFRKHPAYLRKCGAYHLQWLEQQRPRVALLIGRAHLEAYGAVCGRGFGRSCSVPAAAGTGCSCVMRSRPTKRLLQQHLSSVSCWRTIPPRRRTGRRRCSRPWMLSSREPCDLLGGGSPQICKVVVGQSKLQVVATWNPRAAAFSRIRSSNDNTTTSGERFRTASAVAKWMASSARLGSRGNDRRDR